MKDSNILITSEGDIVDFPCRCFFLKVCKIRTRRISMYMTKLNMRMRNTGTRNVVRNTAKCPKKQL